MEKMTNKIALGFVLGLEEVKANVEVFEKLQKMLEQVEKKSKSGKSKPSKSQLENEEIKEVILSVMERIGEPKQIKELNAQSELMEYSSQKLSALIRQLVSSGDVVRSEIKKVAYFEIVKKVEEIVDNEIE